MTPYSSVGSADVDGPRSVHRQCCDCSPASWCQADDQKSIRRPDEMLAPDSSTRVEQRNLFTGNGIYSRQPVGLPLIAMKTSQGQVIGYICPTLSERDTMVYGEAHVLPFRWFAR